MFNREIKKLALVAALALAAAGVAQAQTNDDRLKEFQDAVGRALPEVVGGNQELVDNLLGAKLGKQLSDTFNLSRVQSALFGRARPNFDPNCKRTGTASGDPDQGECLAFLGSEGGGGAYQQLSFSKNIALGNIKYLQRPVAKTDKEETDPKTLAVKLTDQEAYDGALKLLTATIGLDLSEMAFPPGPPNRQPELLVKSLLLATGGDDLSGRLVKSEPVVIQKVVLLQRGLDLPSPIKLGNFEIQKVRAPGQARVVMGDPLPTNPSGIIGFDIFNWQDLRPNDNKSLRAKTRAEMVDEIARELLSLGDNPPAVLKILIGLSAESKGTYGLLLPAVQVYSLPSAMPKDPDEKTQEAFANQATTGHMFEVSMVHNEEKSER